MSPDERELEGVVRRRKFRDNAVALHGAAWALRRMVEELGKAPPGAFAEYEQYGVYPTHIHARRGQHEHATILLTVELGRILRPGVQKAAEANRL